MCKYTDKIRISIIIPVYNAEKYIASALESCQKQTIHDIEIICVNDGSTDNSLSIIEQYAGNDNRIKVYCHKNQGAAASRNYALDIAKGEYIAFLDADDFIEDVDALAKMYDSCSKNNANVCMGRISILEYGKRNEESLINSYVNKNAVLAFTDYQFDFYFPTYLYKRAFLDENNFRFPVLRLYEDPPFLLKVLYEAKMIYTCPVDYYCYRWNGRKNKYSKECVNDLAEGIYNNLIFAKEHKLGKLFEQTLQRVDTIYFEDFCEYLNCDNPMLIKKLIDINNCKNQDSVQIIALRNLIKYGWSEELKYTRNIQRLEELVCPNSRIVLYAAGDRGCRFYKMVKRYPYCKIVLWIDRYKAGQYVEEVLIHNIETIRDIDFDYVFIAIGDEKMVDMAFEELLQQGVAKEKIIRWR